MGFTAFDATARMREGCIGCGTFLLIIYAIYSMHNVLFEGYAPDGGMYHLKMILLEHFAFISCTVESTSGLFFFVMHCNI